MSPEAPRPARVDVVIIVVEPREAPDDQPGLPCGIIEGTKPRRLSRRPGPEALPWLCGNGMLKGREWMAQPRQREMA